MSGIRDSVKDLHPYVPGEQPQGSDVLKLNTNENPYPPSPAVFDAIAGVDTEALRKYPHPTAAPLCRQIADLHGVSEEQVIVGNGSDEILALCTRAFLENDGTIGYMEPSYSLYPVLSDIADVRKQPFPLNKDFSWTVPENVDVDFFFLTRPNAPTSLSLPLDDVRSLCRAAGGSIVLVDEAYADFAEDNVIALLDEFDNLLVSRTLSKSYSLAGLRLGYAVGSSELIEAMYKIKDSYNTDVFAQRVASAAVEDQGWMKVNTSKILNTRTRCHRELESRGYLVIPSSTNFLFARPPAGNAEEIFQHLRANQVIIRYFPGETTGEYLRISVGTDEEMDRFLRVIDAFAG